MVEHCLFTLVSRGDWELWPAVPPGITREPHTVYHQPGNKSKLKIEIEVRFLLRAYRFCTIRKLNHLKLGTYHACLPCARFKERDSWGTWSLVPVLRKCHRPAP